MIKSAINVLLLLTCVRPLFAPGVGPLHGVVLLILPKVDPRYGRQRINIRPAALLGAIALPIWKAMLIDQVVPAGGVVANQDAICLLYTSPSPRDVEESRMPSSA